MQDETTQRKLTIVDTLKVKSVLKQRVFDNTGAAFMMVKDILKNLAKEVNGNLSGIDPRIRMEYTDRSTFDAQLKVAGDMLLFSMHSNIFQFDRRRLQDCFVRHAAPSPAIRSISAVAAIARWRSGSSAGIRMRLPAEWEPSLSFTVGLRHAMR